MVVTGSEPLYELAINREVLVAFNFIGSLFSECRAPLLGYQPSRSARPRLSRVKYIERDEKPHFPTANMCKCILDNSIQISGALCPDLLYWPLSHFRQWKTRQCIFARALNIWFRFGLGRNFLILGIHFLTITRHKIFWHICDVYWKLMILELNILIKASNADSREDLLFLRHSAVWRAAAPPGAVWTNFLYIFVIVPAGWLTALTLGRGRAEYIAPLLEHCVWRTTTSTTQGMCQKLGALATMNKSTTAKF